MADGETGRKEDTKMDWKDWQKEEAEILKLLVPGEQRLELWKSPAPDGTGEVYVLSIRKSGDAFGEYGGPLADITDEKLLAKLRNIKGQFRFGLRVFYYEHLVSPADVRLYEETGKLSREPEKQEPPKVTGPQVLEELRERQERVKGSK